MQHFGLVGPCLIGLALIAPGCGTTDPTGLLPQDPGPGSSGVLPTGNPIPPVIAGPTDLEQLMLERINRARLLPTREAASFGIAIDEGIAGQIDGHSRQAVGFNGALALAARRHADDMLAKDYFAHRNPDNLGPADRMRAAGFPIDSTGENLAWEGTTGTIAEAASVERMHSELFVDKSVRDRGHRVVMLHDAFREVGVSIRAGSFTTGGTTFNALMAVQDYSNSSASDDPILLGVVYDDRNGNGQYDFGEGTANIEIAIDGASRSTGAGGGYAVPVAPGKHTIVFGTGVTVDVQVRTNNVKVDLVNRVRVVTNLGVTDL